MNGVIYPLHNTNLGDHIQSIALYRFLSQRLGQPVTVSTVNAGVDYARRIEEIESLLHPEHKPNYTSEPASTRLEGWYVWHAPVSKILPHLRWMPSTAMQKPGIVTYQLDSVCMPEHAGMPQDEIHALLEFLVKTWKLTVVKLDKSRSLRECAEYLQRSVMFIGADSGMSHLAHTVGTPTYLYERRHPLRWCHKPKQYVPFRTLAEFNELSHYYLRLYGNALDLTDKGQHPEATLYFKGE